MQEKHNDGFEFLKNFYFKIAVFFKQGMVLKKFCKYRKILKESKRGYIH